MYALRQRKEVILISIWNCSRCASGSQGAECGLFDFLGGEADDFVPGKESVREGSEIVSSELVTDGEGELVDHGICFWGNNGSAEDLAIFCCDEFDEAVGEIGSDGARSVFERDESFEVFEVGFDGVVFHEPDGGDDWVSADDFRDDGIVNVLLVFMEEVVTCDLTLEDGFCRGTRAFADDVTSGVDMFGGSLETGTDSDTSFVVVDFCVFETEVSSRGRACGDEDFIDADGFFLSAAEVGDFFVATVF